MKVNYCIATLEFRNYWDLLHYDFNSEELEPLNLFNINLRNDILVRLIHKKRYFKHKQMIMDIKFLKAKNNHKIDLSCFGIGVFKFDYSKFYFIDSKTYALMIKDNRYFSQFAFLNRIVLDQIDFLSNKKTHKINLFDDIYFKNMEISNKIIKPITILKLDQNGNEVLKKIEQSEFLKILMENTSNGKMTN